MGRTKRKRTRKNGFSSTCLDSNSPIISLNQWMKANDWQNINCLRLSHFHETGRGLTASKRTFKLDTLIEVPYDLMITYTSLEDSFLKNAILPSALGKLKIHDLLSIYLVFERHKHSISKWKTYIASLPSSVPLLPWLCLNEEIEKIPEELQSIVNDKLSTFKSSWQRVKESIDPRWKCECCSTPGHCVLTLNSFTWAYVMVNTRAVYVDPDIVRGLSRCSANNLSYALSDDPCMALCPYLDMFNHSNKAATKAKLKKINGKWKFTLTTLTAYEKYEEIFISYGLHDNIKLLCEYGFFIPDNELDTILMDFNEVLLSAKLSVNERQYKFIRNRHLDRDLNVSINGLSFNLKSVLFVILNCDILDWCPYVFSANYSKENLLKMYSVIKHLIQNKIDKCSRELQSINYNFQSPTEFFQNLLSYLQYRLCFMKRLLNSVSEEFV